MDGCERKEGFLWIPEKEEKEMEVWDVILSLQAVNFPSISNIVVAPLSPSFFAHI